jgi:protein arginine N-methyltransferase 7
MGGMVKAGSGYELDAKTKEAIERDAGLKLDQVNPELLAFVVDRSRKAGNEAFKKKDYNRSVEMYCQAIAGNPNDFSLFGNRSAAYLALGRHKDAVIDASKSIILSKQQGDPWAKGYYRLGCALQALEKYGQAAEAFQEGLQLEPNNSGLRAKHEEATARRAQCEESQSRAEGTARRDLVLKLREARRKEVHLQMMNQYKQAMQSPDFEIEDYDWRPTFFPRARFKPKHKQGHADSLKETPSSGSGYSKLVINYCTALADLESPRRDVKALSNLSMLEGYERAIQSALQEQPNAHVIVLGSGTCILPFMAVRAGAGRVTCVLQHRSLYRMAKLSLEQNRDKVDTSKIHILDKPIESCFVQGECDKEEKKEVEVSTIAERADILVTDWFDYRVLGMDVLPSIEIASSRLLKPGVRVIPQSIQVKSMLMELRISDVSGFDLSYLNTYRWNPAHEKISLDRELRQDTKSYQKLSETFVADEIDLQARCDAFVDTSPLINDSELPEWEYEKEIQVNTIAEGVWNAVAFWMDIKFGEDSHASTWNESGCSGINQSADQAVQYFDELQVKEDQMVDLTVLRNKFQLLFDNKQPQKPRHACIPSWHYDMLLDSQRNDAYERAVRKAIESKRAFGEHGISVLDIGAGSGLLSMLAARAGADKVVAVEMSQHMCDVGEETVVMNGYADKILVLNRDARRMDVVRKADGTPPDMEQKADILIYEVFDSGLIGEGALHLVAAARQKLLHPNAVLIPSAGRVYCIPISIRRSVVKEFDFQHLNRYNWRPDYVGVELESCTEDWKALAKPIEVFSFDFYQSEENMMPTSKQFEFEMEEEGIVNAFAFWFDLQLDEENELSTSPFSGKGKTWQQAVQYIEEVKVGKNSKLPITAKHDSYGISFEIDDARVDRGEISSGVPLWDPAWKVSYDHVKEWNQQIISACAQNPSEYRKIADIAVQIGVRPNKYGVPSEEAIKFCTRMMS